MVEQRQTYTLDANGQPLTIHQDGVTMPADHSFACVNEYVHDTGRHFEELQGLALGMACEIDKLRSALTKQTALVAASGWKLVPVESTDDQLVAGQEEWARGRRGALEDCEESAAIYGAMLAAAPAALVAGQEPSEDAAYQLGAKGAEPTESERRLFEAWMRGHCWAVAGEWNGRTYVAADEDGRRVNQHAMLTRQLWAVWRDRAALACHAALPAAEQPETVRVPVETMQRIHRDLDACQKVIWLAGCRPRGYGFDPAYVSDAQERLKEIDALLGKEATDA